MKVALAASQGGLMHSLRTLFWTAAAFSLFYFLFLVSRYEKEFTAGNQISGQKEEIVPGQVTPLVASIQESLKDQRWHLVKLPSVELEHSFYFSLPPKVQVNEAADYKVATATLHDVTVPWQMMVRVTDYAPSFALPDAAGLLKEALLLRVETFEIEDLHFIDPKSARLPSKLEAMPSTLFSGVTQDTQIMGLLWVENRCLVECYLMVERFDQKDAIEKTLVQAIEKIVHASS